MLEHGAACGAAVLMLMTFPCLTFPQGEPGLQGPMGPSVSQHHYPPCAHGGMGLLWCTEHSCPLSSPSRAPMGEQG